jgi:hypothetical protein
MNQNGVTEISTRAKALPRFSEALALYLKCAYVSSGRRILTSYVVEGEFKVKSKASSFGKLDFLTDSYITLLMPMILDYYRVFGLCPYRIVGNEKARTIVIPQMGTGRFYMIKEGVSHTKISYWYLDDSILMNDDTKMNPFVLTPEYIKQKAEETGFKVHSWPECEPSWSMGTFNTRLSNVTPAFMELGHIWNSWLQGWKNHHDSFLLTTVPQPNEQKVLHMKMSDRLGGEEEDDEPDAIDRIGQRTTNFRANQAKNFKRLNGFDDPEVGYFTLATGHVVPQRGSDVKRSITPLVTGETPILIQPSINNQTPLEFEQNYTQKVALVLGIDPRIFNRYRARAVEEASGKTHTDRMFRITVEGERNAISKALNTFYLDFTRAELDSKLRPVARRMVKNRDAAFKNSPFAFLMSSFSVMSMTPEQRAKLENEAVDSILEEYMIPERVGIDIIFEHDPFLSDVNIEEIRQGVAVGALSEEEAANLVRQSFGLPPEDPSVIRANIEKVKENLELSKTAASPNSNNKGSSTSPEKQKSEAKEKEGKPVKKAKLEKEE